jgi:hypothetical protein
MSDNSILTGAEAAAVLDRQVVRREATRWEILHCPADDLAQVERLGSDWEPFAVTTGPSTVARVWWRRLRWPA